MTIGALDTLVADDKLAAEINAAHAAACKAVSDAVQHATHAGELLADVKRRLRHGEFAPWVTQHCTFGLRTAQLYMRLARKLPAEMRNGVSHLTLREAVTLVREARPEGPPYVVGMKPLADRIAWATPSDRARFWALLGQLRARGDPGPTVLAALEHYVKSLGAAADRALDEARRPTSGNVAAEPAALDATAELSKP